MILYGHTEREWSAELTRKAAKAITDILDDIWQAINAADFVIADITGRNPNVLYELGLAHALAKPVLILSRNA